MRRLLLVLVATFLGFLGNAVVWETPVTLAFPFYIIICLILGFVALLMMNMDQLPSRGSRWLFFPPVFFAFTASLNAQQPESLKYRLSLVFTLLYLGLLALTYFGGHLERYCLFDYVYNFARLAARVIVRPAQYIRQLLQDIFGSNQPRFGRDGDRMRLSGGCVRIIAVLFFAALFGLFWYADRIFREFHTSLFNTSKERISEGGGSVLGAVLLSYLILGIFLYIQEYSWDRRLFVDDGEYFRRWLSFPRSGLVYFSASVPLSLFAMLWVSRSYNPAPYLDKNGFPAWIDPRYGFWALAAAAVLVFVLVCWLHHVTRFDGRWDRWIAHTIVNLIFFLFEFILLWAAWVSVSTDTSWIHVMRHVWYARGALFWLGLMFALFIGYEYIQREDDFPFAALLVTTLLVGSYVLIGGLYASVV